MKQFTKERAYALIQEYEESELTQKEFCASRGVKLARFCYWMGKYRRERSQGEGRFTQIEKNYELNAGQVEILCPGGKVVRIYGMPPVEYIVGLVNAL